MAKTDTRGIILNRVFHEIQIHGYQGLRADKVILELGITKGGLYHYFSGKESIGLAIIEEVIEPNIIALFDEITSRPGNPLENLALELDHFMESETDDSISKGWPLHNLIIEMSPISEIFRVRLRHIVEGIIARLEKYIEQGIQKGVVKKEINSKELATSYLSGIMGAYSLAKVYRKADIFITILKKEQEMLTRGISDDFITLNDLV
jgi:TetR/AcrR family transcriptional regulator, transcriptional repressor for nem operon